MNVEVGISLEIARRRAGASKMNANKKNPSARTEPGSAWDDNEISETNSNTAVPISQSSHGTTSRKEEDEFLSTVQNMREKIQRLGTIQKTSEQRLLKLQTATEVYTGLLLNHAVQPSMVSESESVSTVDVPFEDLEENDDIRQRLEGIRERIQTMEKQCAQTSKTLVDKMTSAYDADVPPDWQVFEVEKGRGMSDNPHCSVNSTAPEIEHFPIEPWPNDIITGKLGSRSVSSAGSSLRPLNETQQRKLQRLRATVASPIRKMPRKNTDTMDKRPAVPFVAAKSTGTSHSLLVNWQQLLAALKTAYPVLHEFCARFDPHRLSSSTFMKTFHAEMQKVLITWKKELEELSKDFQSVSSAAKRANNSRRAELLKQANTIAVQMESKDTAIQRIQSQLDAVAETISSNKRRRLCKKESTRTEPASLNGNGKMERKGSKANKKLTEHGRASHLIRDAKSLTAVIKR